MAGGVEGEPPRQDDSADNRPQQAETPAEGGGRAWVTLPGQEQQSWHDRSHAELVSAFRGLIHKEQQAFGDRARFFPPIMIIHDALLQQVQYVFSDDQREKERGAFFSQILAAWDVLTYEQYDENEHLMTKHHAALNLDTKYHRAKARHAPRPELITLDDPLQVRIIDAAAEVSGIPHQRGQTTFEIPSQLWNYREEVHQANEEWRRRRR